MSPSQTLDGEAAAALAFAPLDDAEAARKLEDALAPYDGAVVPPGDPTRHLSLATLTRALGALRPPRERGRLGLIVARGDGHVRQTYDATTLAPGAPLGVDRWRADNKYGDANQLTLMCLEVARTIANGQQLTLFGDNLFVDLDLGEDNLPPGSRLQLGDAVLEITAKPHTGCRQFVQRFGREAVRATLMRDHRAARRRGVHARVVQAGRVAVGDWATVLSRAAAPHLVAAGAS